MRSLAAALVATLLSFAAPAQQPVLRAQVLIVESLPDFERWTENVQGPYPRALREVPVGKPVHFPIVVSGLRPSSADINLVADIEFFAPGGASLGVIRQCCRYSARAGSRVEGAVLANAATLVFGANDVRGTYAVAVSVTDGSQTVTAREDFRFAAPEGPRPAAAPPKPEPAPPPLSTRAAPPPKPATSPPAPKAASAPSSAAEAPKLRMNAPDKSPGRDADKRDCLALPTPAEIIKCAEKKK